MRDSLAPRRNLPLGAVLQLLVAVAAALLAAALPATAAKPNIVVIMTDDQDDRGSLAAMPSVQKLLAKKGITFSNSFVNFPLCCPSRSSFLTGQAAHNHGIVHNAPPLGGYQNFAPREGNSLGVWLQDAGYVTGLMGKVLNGYGETDPTHVIPGWTDWRALVDIDRTYGYFDYGLNENGTLHHYGHKSRHYVTDVLANHAVAFINAHAGGPQPFFLLVTPVAPHDATDLSAPIPAPRDAGHFAALPFPQRPGFNEADVSDKPGLIRNAPQFNAAEIAAIIDQFRKRRESLLAVDRMVKRIVAALDAAGVAEETIVVFTSDNGFTEGVHRWNGKRVMYEESLRVPLVIRWPGKPQNQIRSQLVTNLDLVATIIEQTEATPGNLLDGRPLTPIIDSVAAPWRTAFVIQGSGDKGYESNHFMGVRTARYAYAEHQSQDFGFEVELYDLVRDPDQLQNRAAVAKYANVVAFLSGLLDTLSICAGDSCWVTAEPPAPTP